MRGHGRTRSAIFGHEVPAERIRGQIGKGADQLMPVFGGGAEVAKHGKEMERFRADRFRERYLPHARAFPGSASCLSGFGGRVAPSRSHRPARLKSWIAI